MRSEFKERERERMSSDKKNNNKKTSHNRKAKPANCATPHVPLRDTERMI